MTTNSDRKHYADRDSMGLGKHFLNHMSALTSENLYAKSEIADELAYRDSVIQELLNLLDKTRPNLWDYDDIRLQVSNTLTKYKDFR